MVSPKKKSFKLFKEDAFINEILQENFYSNKLKVALPPPKPRKTQKIKKNKDSESYLEYEKRLAGIKNIYGGGALVDGKVSDLRKAMDQIVKDYPQVRLQKKIFLREQALKLKDANGVPLHKTPEMLLAEKDVDAPTEFE